MEKIRLKIQEVLNDKKLISVNRESSLHVSGVYLLYIDDLFDGNIFPFYIGKSKDIQKRYFEHLEKILFLNKLESSYLNNLILDEETLEQYYSGYYLYIKIHKFMIENKKDLDDIKMIILEEADEELLFEKESYFIDRFKAPYVGFNQFNSRTKRFQTIEERNEIIAIEMKEIPKWIDFGYTKFNLDVVYTSYLGNLLQSEADFLPYSKFYKDLVYFIEKNVVTIKDLDYLINLRNLRNKSIIKKIDSISRKEKIINEIYSDFFQWAKININNFEKEFRYRDEREKLLKSILISEENNYLYIDNFEQQHLDAFEQFKLFETREIESIKYIEKYNDEIISEMSRTFDKIKTKKVFNSFALKSLSEDLSISREKKENVIQLFILLGNNGRRKNSESFVMRIEMYKYQKDSKDIEKKWYIKNDSTIAIKDGLGYVESDLYYKDKFLRNLFGAQMFKIIPEDFRNYISTNVEMKYGINDYTLKNKILVDFGSVLDELEILIKEDTEIIIKISEGPAAFKVAMAQVFDFSFDLEEQFKENKILKDLRKKVPKSRKIVLNKQKIRKNKENKVRKIKTIPEEELKIRKEIQEKKRFEKYKNRVRVLSDNKIKVIEYQGSKEQAYYECQICYHKWNMRADRITRRPHCPYCKKMI